MKSELAQVLGWTIVHSLWQVALVALILKLLLTFISEKLPNLRYILLLAGLVLVTAWSTYTFLNEYSYAKMSNQELLLEEHSSGKMVISSQNAKRFVLEEIGIVSAESNFSLRKKLRELKPQFSPFMPFIATIWYLGVFLFSIYLITGFFHLNYLSKNGISTPAAFWQTKYEALKKKIGLAQPVRLFFSEICKEPITFYFFHPVILMPLALISGLTTKQVEILILHELAHIKRHDFLINVFQTIIEVLFFYHPAVRWMSNKVRQEREHCCDDLVLKIVDNPVLYAETLTNIQLSKKKRNNGLVLAATGTHNIFSKRIFRIFGKYDEQTSFFKGILLLLLLLPCTLGLVNNLPQQYSSASEALSKKIMEIVSSARAANRETATLPQQTANSRSPLITDHQITTAQNQLPPSQKVITPLHSMELDSLHSNKEPKLSLKSLDKASKNSTAPIKTESNKQLPLKVTLEARFKENSEHIYFKTFRQDTARDFIFGLYQLNKASEQNCRLPDESAPIISNRKGENSLIFTLTSDDGVEYDTLKNIVHPEWELLKKKGEHLPITGNLPKGVWSGLEKKAGNKYKLILYIMEQAKNVKVLVTNQQAEPLKTLVDQKLNKGEHPFFWKPTDRAQNYMLTIQIDGKEMTYFIEPKQGKR